ncbi:gliding motility lipoprotein GldD [Antarcticibacterium flavum]|uniref:Gliding motility lipoprotein GldD n=1 Tax=Antarcticibacterium flavum TaxID=2058175 RepID=A0A5B7X2P9_9FLAO|nr:MULTISPECIES: gliding motility lipoprotein GldD [Antarcticibacterium]MCM4160512.1 gliding motility lipoprotein GldD [Antarcticibacterium sp. W02-3]QCY69824.1 gliding motility lipoprotein GldD [Antarcticibacterium flavum]
MKNVLPYILCLFLLASCGDEAVPKPKAFLALEYPEANYLPFRLNCPFSFEKNDLSIARPARSSNPCWINLDYQLLNATVFITYQSVNGNIDSLLMDAQRLPLQHTIKADFIEGDIYTNPGHNTYGMFYEVDGDAASQAQFYVTDSVSHFLTGSLYFNKKPNFDSIMPAAAYLKKDMKHLMETLKWQD